MSSSLGLTVMLRRLGLKSLRSQMYVWLIVPMVILSIINGVISYVDASNMARSSIDQKLLSSARLLGESVRLEDGHLQANIPPAAIENLWSPEADRVYYRIDSVYSGLLSGVTDLPLLQQSLVAEGWKGFDGQVRNEPVRVVIYAQPIFSDSNINMITIEVATTKGEFNDLVRHIWSRSVLYHTVLLIVAILFSHLWIKDMLVPISRISNTVRQQQTTSTAKLDVQDVPTEMLPLIDSINYHMDQVGHYVSEHDRFISNAAHQMKTPLAILNTQTMVGLRSEDLDSKQKVLLANHQTLQHCIRSMEQLLALSTVNHKLSSNIPKHHFNLLDVVQDVLVNMVELANKKQIDLGVQTEADQMMIYGVQALVSEMVSNLIDNAIRYTPEGGMVTVCLTEKPDGNYLEVLDSGPGLAAAERDKVFERYYRVSNASTVPGSGLGLAIVKEIVLSMDARIALLDRPDGQSGLLVQVVFPHTDASTTSLQFEG